MERTLEEIVRDNADVLDTSPQINFSGEVHDVDIDGAGYAVTITLTRKGAPDFHELYLRGK